LNHEEDFLNEDFLMIWAIVQMLLIAAALVGYNVYLRHSISHDLEPGSPYNEAYRKAEQERGADDDLGSDFHGRG
jgi:predicted negative regulator of RcsB-dependent stress response